MEHGFSILMLVFGAMILIYAALVGLGGFDLIPRGWSVKVKNKKLYAKQFAKLLMLTALAPILGGLIGFLNTGVGAVVTVIAFVFFIRYGIQLTHINELLGNSDNERDTKDDDDDDPSKWEDDEDFDWDDE